MNNQNVELKTRDIAVAIGSAFLGVVFISLAIWGGFNIGFSLFNILLLIIGTAYFKRKKVKFNSFAIALFVTNILGSLTFMLTTNSAVNFVLFCLLFFNGAAYFYLLNRGTNELGDLRIAPIVFASVFATSLEGLSKSNGALLSKKDNSGNTKKFLIGALCALPALLIIIPLLVSSDMAFEGLVKAISKDVILWVVKIILGILIAPFIFSYFFSNRKFKDNFNFKNGLKNSKIDITYAVSFLGVISVCYIVYLFSQLAYFMGGLSGILPEDYTVAQYARRGFFEITAICLINFVIFSLGILLIKKSGDIKDRILKGMLWFVGIFTMLLIITAIAKMVLYIDSFGMTELRILTSVFLIFLFVVCALLVARSISKKVTLLRPTMLVAIILLTVMGFVGVNRTVASYNTNAYINGSLKTLDAYTISECGPVSAKYLIKLEKYLSKKDYEENKTEYNAVVNSLIDVFDEMYELKDNGKYKRIKSASFASFNFEKEQAYLTFDKYLKKNPEFLEKVNWCKNVQYDNYNHDDYVVYKLNEKFDYKNYGNDYQTNIWDEDKEQDEIYVDDDGFIHEAETQE